MAKSSSSGCSPSRGAPIVIGSVLSARPAPPQGATQKLPGLPMLTQAKPIIFAAAACSPHSPSRPMWLQATAETAATPASPAISIARAIANRAVSCPNPHFPLTSAQAGPRRTTSGRTFGSSCPSRISRMYWLIRITPCESCPARFESTSDRASRSAASSGAPAATKIRRV